MRMFFEIFWAFIKPGVFGFGGGQATIPLIQAEVVDNHKWITEDQFADFLAMGNTLPGPIAVKMSIIVGMQIHGYLGALAAFLGMILPSSIAILVLFNVFFEYKNTAFVKGMQLAAKPVVVVLIAGVAYSMARASFFKTVDFSFSSTWIIWGIFLVSTVLFLLNEYIPSFNVHPALIVLSALLIGGFFIR